MEILYGKKERVQCIKFVKYSSIGVYGPSSNRLIAVSAAFLYFPKSPYAI